MANKCLSNYSKMPRICYPCQRRFVEHVMDYLLDSVFRKDSSLIERLRDAVVLDKVLRQFKVVSSGSIPEEPPGTLVELGGRIYGLTPEELVAEANIQTRECATGERVYQQIEEYIATYTFSGGRVDNARRIELYLKNHAFSFVHSTVQSGNESEQNWDKLASYIWGRIDCQLGGIENVQRVINLSTEVELPHLDRFLKAIRTPGSFEQWEDSIHDSYVILKKAVLLRGPLKVDLDPEWKIHQRDNVDSTYYADLLNQRVLALWRLTTYGEKNGKLIQYLRSERGGDTYASWCHPDGDPMGDRKKESCYYLVDSDGIALVREFNECLDLTNEQDLHAAAMTIIQDVIGDIDMKTLSEIFYENVFNKDLSAVSKDDIVSALLEVRFAKDNSLSIGAQFDLRLNLLQLSAEDLILVVKEEGFVGEGELLSLYGRTGSRARPDPRELEFISTLQYMPDDEVAKFVNCGDLKTIHDHLYDFYISNDSGATYREYFDKGLILLLLEYHKKSDEVYRDLVDLEFPDSSATDLKELINLEPGAKEYCVDYIWDKGMTGRSGQDLSSDFMVFALKKISSDHAKLTRRLSKTLLKSIDPDQKLIQDFFHGESEQDAASDSAPEMPSDLIKDSITREQLINAMVNEWIVDCYCAPDEGDDPPEVKRQQFEAMSNAALLKQLNFDKDYTIHDYIDQYSKIAEGYAKAFNPSADDLQNASKEERSIIARAARFIKDFRNKS